MITTVSHRLARTFAFALRLLATWKQNDVLHLLLLPRRQTCAVRQSEAATTVQNRLLPRHLHQSVSSQQWLHPEYQISSRSIFVSRSAKRQPKRKSSNQRSICSYRNHTYPTLKAPSLPMREDATESSYPEKKSSRKQAVLLKQKHHFCRSHALSNEGERELETQKGTMNATPVEADIKIQTLCLVCQRERTEWIREFSVGEPSK